MTMLTENPVVAGHNRDALPSLDRVGPHTSVAELAAAVIATAATSLAGHEAGLRRGTAPEDVHQARVATRRLRARLRTLRPVLDEAWVAEVNVELKWLAEVLGAVRDTDVLYAELESHVPTLPPPDVLEARALLAQLAGERRAAVERLQEVLDSDRYQALMARLVAGATEPPVRRHDGHGDARARSVMPSLVAQRWKRLRRDVGRFGEDPSNEALHEARKDAKKLRYAGEMARSVVGGRAKGLTDAAEAVQGVLGEVHDAAVAETWLRHQVLVGGGAAGAVAAGELIEREHERYWANRARWAKVWKNARKKRLRAWLDKS